MRHRQQQNNIMLVALVMITVTITAMVIINPVIAVAAEKTHPGQSNFEEFCASCHGYDGIPVLPGTPNFSSGERLNIKDNELLQTISKGKGDVMPPWESVLKKQAQQDVLNYIKNVIHQKQPKKNK